jgi:hypothetical protein
MQRIDVAMTQRAEQLLLSLLSFFDWLHIVVAGIGAFNDLGIDIRRDCDRFQIGVMRHDAADGLQRAMCQSRFTAPEFHIQGQAFYSFATDVQADLDFIFETGRRFIGTRRSDARPSDDGSVFQRHHHTQPDGPQVSVLRFFHVAIVIGEVNDPRHVSFRELDAAVVDKLRHIFRIIRGASGTIATLSWCAEETGPQPHSSEYGNWPGWPDFWRLRRRNFLCTPLVFNRERC